MGSLGTSRVGPGPSPCGRGGESGPEEPTLEGPFGGQSVVSVLSFQHDADQAGAPRRVVATEGDGLLDEGLGELRCRGPAPVIRRSYGVLAKAPEPEDQLADGAWCESEFLGDRGAILAVLGTPPDGLSYGHGEGARHGRSSLEDTGCQTC